MYIFLQNEIGVKHVLKRKIISKLLGLRRCPHKIENILPYHVNIANNKLGLESLKHCCSILPLQPRTEFMLFVPKAKKKIL